MTKRLRFHRPKLLKRDLSTLLAGRPLKTGEQVAVRFPNGTVLPGWVYGDHVQVTINGAAVFIGLDPLDCPFELARTAPLPRLKSARRPILASGAAAELERRVDILRRRDKEVSATRH